MCYKMHQQVGTIETAKLFFIKDIIVSVTKRDILTSYLDKSLRYHDINDAVEFFLIFAIAPQNRSSIQQ